MPKILAATILALSLLPTTTAQCQGYCTAQPCYGAYGCPSGCSCIQPDGPGSQGWCNG